MKKELADYLNGEADKLKAEQKKLTPGEQNLIKDILKVIGSDDSLNQQFALAVGLEEEEFDRQTDLIFNKLGNGRLTVQE